MSKYGHGVDTTTAKRLTGRDYTRELVRVRDGHECKDCGKAWVAGTRRLDVHHMDGLCGKRSRGYDRLEDIARLITLCHECHYNQPSHSQYRD